MSDIKLFSLDASGVSELAGNSALLEKNLQTLVESQLEIFLGVRFLATEHRTGKTHNGRIDTLGLDENNCPVIIEYKRRSNENVISQGLFYLDWLLDHRAEFQWLVMEKLDKAVAESIEWGGTRLICIATDFNRYDEHAVQQIDRNIELMRYRYFGDNLLLLELVNSQSAVTPIIKDDATPSGKGHPTDKTQSERLSEAPDDLKQLFQTICDFAISLGDEVQRKDLKLYTAFKRIKNFLSMVVLPANKDPRLQIYLKLDPQHISPEYQAISRDVSNIGHWGTGNLEVMVRTQQELSQALELIRASYELN